MCLLHRLSNETVTAKSSARVSGTHFTLPLTSCGLFFSSALCAARCQDLAGEAEECHQGARLISSCQLLRSSQPDGGLFLPPHLHPEVGLKLKDTEYMNIMWMKGAVTIVLSSPGGDSLWDT